MFTSSTSRHGQVPRLATHPTEAVEALQVKWPHCSPTPEFDVRRNTYKTLDVSNMNVTNLSATALRGAAVSISQCTAFSGGGTPTNCTNSEVQIHDIMVQNLTGTTSSDDVASLQCSAVKPCYNIALEDIDLTLTTNTSAQVTEYLCSEVQNAISFNCTGSACVGSSDTGEC